VGDDAGFADIVGRKYGTSKLPYNSSKSYVGSLAFLVFASLASMGYVANIEVFCSTDAPRFFVLIFVVISTFLAVFRQFTCTDSELTFLVVGLCGMVQVCGLLLSVWVFHSNGENVSRNVGGGLGLCSCRVFASST
jgi:hypothetical protein